MNCSVICVGKCKEKWQTEACTEYKKRLSRFGSFEIIEVADLPEPEKAGEAIERQIMEREGKSILSKIKPNDRVVALCIEGTNPSSAQLAQKMADWSMDGKRLVLVIGGSLGLSEEVKSRADFKLSFSKMTFPHPLMRVILLEQMYRAMKINAGERYHK